MKKTFVIVGFILIPALFFSQHIMDEDERKAYIWIPASCQFGASYYHQFETTLLIETVKENYYSCVEYVLKIEEYREEINKNWVQYAPPLYWSFRNGNKEITELLLQYGADPDFVNLYGLNAFDLIEELLKYNHITSETAEELKSVLIEYGYGKSNPCLFAINDTSVVKENLRLRRDAILSGDIVTTLQAGSQVKIINLGKYENIDGLDSRWVKVEVLEGGKDRDGNSIPVGTTGWCYAGYLE